MGCDCDLTNKSIESTDRITAMSEGQIRDGFLFIPIYFEHFIVCRSCGEEYFRVEHSGKYHKFEDDGIYTE